MANHGNASSSSGPEFAGWQWVDGNRILREYTEDNVNFYTLEPEVVRLASPVP
jgi:hypothetical protein